MNLPKHIKDKHFIVVDDYESMRQMVTESLKGLGVTNISSAASGNTGFEKILSLAATATPIQFVVTDLMMEDGNGIDLAKKIRGNPATKHLPILMVTSKSEVSYVIESIKAGVNNYVVKPWTMEDLCKRIQEVDAKANPA